jgi:hypothetical protein
MKSKFIIDPQDPFGDGVSPVGDGNLTNFFPASFSFSTASFYPAASRDGEGPPRALLRSR